jgi:hypothetical protein
MRKNEFLRASPSWYPILERNSQELKTRKCNNICNNMWICFDPAQTSPRGKIFSVRLSLDELAWLCRSEQLSTLRSIEEKALIAWNKEQRRSDRQRSVFVYNEFGLKMFLAYTIKIKRSFILYSSDWINMIHNFKIIRIPHPTKRRGGASFVRPSCAGYRIQ